MPEPDEQYEREVPPRGLAISALALVVAAYRPSVPDAESLVERADEAMHRAKSRGGDAVAVAPEGSSTA